VSDGPHTVWRADPHTLAKHRILRAYLHAWFPILSRTTARYGRGKREPLYVDGFAGPGIYEAGEPGSPLIALDAALSHQRSFPQPIRFVFIELDPERHASLRRQLAAIRERTDSAETVRLDPPILGDCKVELSHLLDRANHEGRQFGPALVFLDQFGYSEVPIDLVCRIMEIPQCEVLTYLHWQNFNRFLSDATKWRGIDEAYGSEEWKTALNMSGTRREQYLFGCYESALREHGGAKYVINFAMCGEQNELLYRLFFCTNHLRGLEEMKRAMWKEDARGTFRFSDRDHPDQLWLVEEFTQDWLAGRLKESLRGRELSVDEVKEHVLTDTPCYRFKESLKILEANGDLEVVGPPARRRRGTFGHSTMRVRFL